LAEWLNKISDLLWSFPLVFLLFLLGLYFTVKLKFLQIEFLPKSFRFMFEKEKGADGDITGFGALCTELAATLGTGNIVGVAAAIKLGGAGSLFWMAVTGVLMMSVKYAESFLSVKFRVKENGKFSGGPFYYIERGMGERFKPLAKTFAFFGGAAGLLGMGTFTQIKAVTSAIENFLDPQKMKTIKFFGAEFSVFVCLSAAIFAFLTLLVLLGGVKRIAKVSEFFVPLMAFVYLFFCLVIIFSNFSRVFGVLSLVLKDAFNFKSVLTGGTCGFVLSFRVGMARGIFTNEAGLGTAPIAAASAKTNSPFKQGIISMSGVFLDTVVMCTITGLTILLAADNENLDATSMVSFAFKNGINFLNDKTVEGILAFCLVFFAFSTIIGWNFFSSSCFSYFSNGKFLKIYNSLYVFAVLVGSFIPFTAVLHLADIFNALMLIPNVIALIFLRKTIINETKMSLNES
jgi:AGCS family alanine or glycine:cation symporter